MRRSGCLKVVMAFLTGLAVLIGWAEFMFKPLRFYAKQQELTFADAFADLLKIQPTAYDWPFSGYVFILATAFLLYLAMTLTMRPVRAALDFLERSEAPISILESRIELFMEDKQLNRCTTRRRQILHSNRDDVDAYHYSQTTMHGHLDRDLLRIESRIDGELITKKLLKRGNNKSADTIEIFTKKMPTNVFATYFPDVVVLFLYKHLNRFKKSLVYRECDGVDLNEYSIAEPIYQITALRYPVSNIEVILNLPEESIYRKGTLKAFLIMNQAVSELPVTSINDEKTREKYRVTLGKLRQHQSLRLTWENSIPVT